MISEFILVYKILKWQKKQFPEATEVDQFNKVKEECWELKEAFDKYLKARSYGSQLKYKISVREELIDVIISGIGLLRYSNYLSLAKDKLKINKKRFWRNNHHVEKRRSK